MNNLNCDVSKISEQKRIEWIDENDQKTIYINEKKIILTDSYLNGRESLLGYDKEFHQYLVADTESRLA